MLASDCCCKLPTGAFGRANLSTLESGGGAASAAAAFVAASVATVHSLLLLLPPAATEAPLGPGEPAKTSYLAANGPGNGASAANGSANDGAASRLSRFARAPMGAAASANAGGRAFGGRLLPRLPASGERGRGLASATRRSGHRERGEGWKKQRRELHYSQHVPGARGEGAEARAWLEDMQLGGRGNAAVDLKRQALRGGVEASGARAEAVVEVFEPYAGDAGLERRRRGVEPPWRHAIARRR